MSRSKWDILLDRWEAMHVGLDSNRPARLELILDVLSAGQSSRFRCLDLGAGPGSFAREILARFPKAVITCVDYDRTMLHVGIKALKPYGKRTRWVCADLRRPGWESSLGTEIFDSVVSSLTLHLLRTPELRRLYRTLAHRVTSGGMLIIADYLPWGGTQARMDRLSDRVRELRSKRGDRISRQDFADQYKEWWTEAREPRTPSEPVTSRNTRSAGPVSIATHVRLLRHAGFRNPMVVWQDLNTRVLVANR
jgi:SAM-dependent methyltransferase